MSKCVFDYGEDMCYAVTEKQCQGCRFRKTAEELQEGRDKATKRLMTLDRLRPGKTMSASVEYCIGLFASELIESKIGKASDKA